MSAEKGNNYAEKWTSIEAVKFIDKVVSTIENNEASFHLGELISKAGYYPDLWSYISRKFADNEEVFRAIKKTEVMLEARIVNSTLSGKIKSAAMAIFYLKNKYGYKDRQELDHTVKETKIGAEAAGIKIGYVNEHGAILKEPK